MAFRKEAHRRAKRSIEAGGDPGRGIGFASSASSELFEPGERYEAFPAAILYRPGNLVVDARRRRSG